MNNRNPIVTISAVLSTSVLFFALSGCEPPLESFSDTATPSSDLLVSDLRGMKLDWPVDGDHLEVSKPPRFEFMNSITGLRRNSALKSSSSDEDSVETTDGDSRPVDLTPWSVPPGLLPVAEQEAFLRAVGEVKAEVRSITDVSCLPSTDGRFYDISPNAKWLASAHSKVQLYDLQSSSVTHECALSGGSPVSCVRFSADSQHLLVAAGKKLLQFNVASGTLTAEIDLPSEAQAIVIASQSNWMVVALNNDRVVAVKSDFSDLSTLSEKIPSSYPAPALSPSGNTLAFWTEKGGVAVTLTDGTITDRVEHSFSEWDDAPANEISLGTICSDTVAYWLAKDHAYCFQFTDLTDDVRKFQWPLLAAAQGTVPGHWLVGAFARPGEHSDSGSPACLDLEIYPNLAFSTAVDLPLTSVSSLRCDSTGTWVAFQQDKKVYAFQRTKWVNRDTSVFENLVRNWMRSGDCELLEKVSPVLRAMPELRLSRSGEQWHNMLVQGAAQVRVYPEDYNLTPEAIKKQDAWIAADSYLARNVDAAIEIGVATKLYYGLLRGEGTQDQMAEVQRLTRSAIQKTDKLLSESNPPLSAYVVKTEALFPGRVSIEMATPFVQEVVKRYPLDYSIHDSILKWLAPYSIGERGDLNAYAYALAKAIGGDQGDRMYAELVVNIIYMAKGSTSTASLRDDILTRGILVGLKEGYWSNHEMINLARAQSGESMSNLHSTSRQLVAELMRRIPVAPPELRRFTPIDLTPRN